MERWEYVLTVCEFEELLGHAEVTSFSCEELEHVVWLGIY